MTDQIISLVEQQFPFTEFRPHQKETIIDIVRYLAEPKNKYYVCEAPTGSGKSVIGATAASVLLTQINKYLPITKPPIVVGTKTKSLQLQYLQSFSDAEALWSARSYPCTIYPNYPEFYYGSPVCYKARCKKRMDCEYVCKKLRIKYAKLAILNYHYFMYSKTFNPTVLILDEAHNLESILCDIITIKISKAAILKILKTVQKFNIPCNKILVLTTVSKILTVKDTSKLIETLLPLFYGLQKALIGIKQGLTEKLVSLTEDERIEISSRIVNLDFIIKKLDTFSTDTKWILAERSDTSIIFKPLDVTPIAAELLQRADKVIFLSATFSGINKFAEILNIKDFQSVSLPSTIPVDRRPIQFLKAGYVKSDNIVESLQNFAPIIDAIISEFKDQSGIIHSVSYKNAELIVANSKYKHRMFIPTTQEVRELDSIMKNRPGIIVVSPSILEGIDLKGDLSRFQIFPKVPYPYLGDKWVKLKMENDYLWYIRETITKVVQGCGRSVRGEDDFAATFLLDTNFNKLLQKKEMFPPWYLEAITQE